jgi:hypothetical protein
MPIRPLGGLGLKAWREDPQSRQRTIPAGTPTCDAILQETGVRASPARRNRDIKERVSWHALVL